MGLDEAVASRGGQRVEDGCRELVARRVEPASFAQSGVGERHASNARIAVRSGDDDEALRLEAAEQAAEIPRVEPEPSTELAHVGAALADLPQQARGAE